MIKAPIDQTTGENLVQYYLRRWSSLETEQSSYKQHWEDIAKAIEPRSMRLQSSEVNKGNKRNGSIINATAGYSLGVLASGMMSGVTSPSRPWIQLRAADPALNDIQAVRIWLEDTRNRLAEVFIKSNLYTTLPTTYRELGGFGTNAFALMEDDEDTIRCHPIPLGSYVLITGPRGNVVGMIRRLRMTVAQLVKQFGLENCSTTVQDSFKRKDLDTYHEIYHCVDENPEADGRKLSSRYLPYRSVYFETANNEDRLLSLKGYHDFCIMAPRWTTVGEDVYGISPGMNVLGDVQQLQIMEKRKLQLLDMLVQPPRSVPAALRNEYVGTLAGENTFVADSNQKIEPNYVPNPYFNHLTQEIQNIEARIRKLLHEDLFLMVAEIERSGVTATEIQARLQEKMMVLGPIMERLNDELLDPLVKRTLGILQRAGKLLTPPQELQGQAINVEYISIMAQAMKIQGVVGTERLVGFVGSISAMRPDALDKLNVDEIVDNYADMVGTSPKNVNDDATVKQIREQRAQDQQREQMLAAANQGAQAAKTMSEVDVSTPSMLTNMVGSLAAQGGAQ